MAVRRTLSRVAVTLLGLGLGIWVSRAATDPEVQGYRGEYFGWFLAVDPADDARVELDGDPTASARVTITRLASGKPWGVCLNVPVGAVHRGRFYRAQFAARADRPRRLVATLQSSGPRQQSLGFWTEYAVDRGWQTYTGVFRSTADDADPRLCFNLGLELPSVEIRGVSLAPLPEHGGP